MAGDGQRHPRPAHTQAGQGGDDVVLREGRAIDIQGSVDRALLVDLWDELVPPRDVREAWTPLITATLAATPSS